jgi:hypothetical protein
MDLQTKVQGLLKTPGAQDALMESMNSKGISGSSGNLAQEAMNGILMERMQGLLPTPTKSEAIDVARTVVMKGNSPRSQSNQGVDGQAKLVDMLAAGMLPTPPHSDCGAKQTANSNQPGLLAITGQTGHLSHLFTLDLMGFPKTWCDISEPVLVRLDKHLSRLKRTSEKNQTGSGKKPSNVPEMPLSPK